MHYSNITDIPSNVLEAELIKREVIKKRSNKR